MIALEKLKEIKNKLNKNLLTLGTWLQIPSETCAEILSSSEAFDWVCIDLEHSPISIETCESLIRAIEGSGSIPIVRLTSNNSDLIKRVMDSGALGIIVPMVCDYNSVLKAVNEMHFPPKGKRGVGLARAQGWGRRFTEYKDQIGDQYLLIAQIEHIDAVNNIDEIFGSGFIDAYIIGPYDLSASLGSPGNFDTTEFISAVKSIKEAAKKHNIPSGFHLVEPDTDKLKELIREGYSFIAYSVDTVILREAGNIDVD